LLKEKVEQVLSFGGYLAVPFALAAKRLGVPIVTHEQTRVLGRANRLVGVLADKIAVSYPGVGGVFGAKVVVTGNPLREGLFKPGAKRPSWFTPTKNQLGWLYVTGGSQGSKTIRENFWPLLTQIKDDLVIIHQLGRESVKYQPCLEMADFMAREGVTSANYFGRDYLTADELAYFYPRLTMAISRSGANSVAELTAFGVPTLYIPLPQAYYREQLLNARAVVEKGGALILEQADLTPLTLLEKLDELTARAGELKEHLQMMGREKEAAARIVALLSFRVGYSGRRLGQSRLK
jgi:UDP-N-acetylglucosamine--N-acetylmuramyl-(pentapeptide) pyrophosphoryl-undecaprenol N-acetylglucosamine transferase